MATSLASVLTLSACAGSRADYPSFAIPTANEEAARVSMRFPGVEVPDVTQAPPPVEPLPAELDARLAAINRRAEAAANAFRADLDGAQSSARAGRASARESDAWANAQLRVADLTAHHSAAQLALADLDALAVTAQLGQSAGTSTAKEGQMIAQLQTQLGQTVSEQARLLDQINAQLDR
ncbi:MAG: hypothetical protein AAF291_11935 [Pseudomonadota bacterium]